LKTNVDRNNEIITPHKHIQQQLTHNNEIGYYSLPQKKTNLKFFTNSKNQIIKSIHLLTDVPKVVFTIFLTNYCAENLYGFNSII